MNNPAVANAALLVGCIMLAAIFIQGLQQDRRLCRNVGHGVGGRAWHPAAAGHPSPNSAAAC